MNLMTVPLTCYVTWYLGALFMGDGNNLPL